MEINFPLIVLIVCGVYFLGRWLKKKKEANEAAAQPSDLQRAARMADEGKAPGAQPGDSRVILTQKALNAIRAEQGKPPLGASAAPGTPAKPAAPAAGAPVGAPASAPVGAPASAPATASPAAAPAASAPPSDGALSLRSGEKTPPCPVCGQALTGYGEAGGFCSACNAWQYDRSAYLADREQYGDGAETLHVLAGYDNVRLTGGGLNRTGRMLVTPGMLLFPGDATGTEPLKLFYRDIVSGSVTTGAAQQWTLVHKNPADGRSLCLNIDLRGHTYDHSGGRDLERLKLLTAR